MQQPAPAHWWTLCALATLLFCSACDSLGYRVKWRGFADAGAEEDDRQRHGMELFGHSTAARTVQLAWLHWEVRHRDLSRALARNSKNRSLGRYYDLCIEALGQIERELPQRAQLLDDARSRYRRLKERAPQATPGGIKMQLRQITTVMEALAKASDGEPLPAAAHPVVGEAANSDSPKD